MISSSASDCGPSASISCNGFSFAACPFAACCEWNKPSLCFRTSRWRKNASTAKKMTTMDRGTPTEISIIIPLFGLAVGDWAKLVGTLVEGCNCIDAKEPLTPMTEVLVAAVVDSTLGAAVLVRLENRGLVDSVGVDNINVISIAENGYGSSEVVRLVSQQFAPPRTCPACASTTPAIAIGIADTDFGEIVVLTFEILLVVGKL